MTRDRGVGELESTRAFDTKIAHLLPGDNVSQILEERQIKESMRFDPKLKGKGLLDLYMEKQPDTSVPK